MIPSHAMRLLSVAMCFLSQSGPIHAGPGDQDSSFGPGGIAEMPFPPALRSLQSLAVQDDGKIVGAGPADSISSSIGVVRWLATGTVDSGFGSGGIATLMVASEEKVRIALAPDSKIVVMANRRLNATDYDLLVWRFLSTGALDSGFGTAGQVLIPQPAGKSGLGRCLTVQTDGKILVGGGSEDGFFLWRLGTAGMVDPTFGVGGMVRSVTINQQYRLTALAQQTDGFIVAAGWQKDGTVARNPFLLRLQPPGTVDAAFGSNGFRFLFPLGEFNALTLRGDGAVVAAGVYQGDALVTVLRASGVRDDLFAPDNDGRIFDLGGTDAIDAVTVQSNGRIVLSGSVLAGSTVRAVSAGITSEGNFDAAFGSGGTNFHDFRQEFNAAGQSSVEAVAGLPDGRLLVGGVLYGFGYSGAVLHRLEADTVLHPVESWRIANFGTRVNSGPGADAADPDLDGVPNLAEYAFGQNPNNRLSRSIPVPSLEGNVFRLAFPDPDANEARRVSFRAEASAFLTAGSWQQLPETGDAANYLFDLPVTGNPRAFVRLLVDLYP